ncbi:MAG: hypothetical protein WC289_05830 [Patescibacteria group bacterium]|jgi:uncharacterized membrane protein
MDEKPMNTLSSESKLMAALSYVWIVSVIMLLIKKDDQFVYFHARQGLVLFLASFIGIIPVIGWFLWILVLLLDLFGFIKALSGERYALPGVSTLAEKIKI